MDNRPIGIFDSGVGGLTAVRQLIREAPGESFVYFGDTLRAPYGDRTPEDIRFLSRRNARFLRVRGVKALIVACNTSTANAMAELEADNADIPIVGTVGAAAARAAAVTKTGRIGVIATNTVIQSGIYERSIRALLPEARPVLRGCPRLVPLIEAGHTAPEDPELAAALREYLAPMKEAEVDTLVLGCTHYPLISGAVRAVLGDDVSLVDSGGACVGSILAALADRNALADPAAVRTERYYCSGNKIGFTAVAEGFLGKPIDDMTETAQIEGY
jgi:glutamate racemase